jgi:hypothetical protein
LVNHPIWENGVQSFDVVFTDIYAGFFLVGFFLVGFFLVGFFLVGFFLVGFFLVGFWVEINNSYTGV